ncbi:MAG: hypothetical protein DHS20C10_01850 [marine bacterium B5-7]|nr:MAG: hypothetical protein DHS20C10_01850 [marine bacterium B5-7]
MSTVASSYTLNTFAPTKVGSVQQALLTPSSLMDMLMNTTSVARQQSRYAFEDALIEKLDREAPLSPDFAKAKPMQRMVRGLESGVITTKKSMKTKRSPKLRHRLLGWLGASNRTSINPSSPSVHPSLLELIQIRHAAENKGQKSTTSWNDTERTTKPRGPGYS